MVVVMIWVGFLGSADRCDWENLREERLLAASSLDVSGVVGVCLPVEAVGISLEEASVSVKLEGYDKGGKEVVGVLRGQLSL